MANTDMRMYIGARYVPRFRGEYVASEAYEGLDVVDDGVGVAYIAKKPVPPNTLLSNTEYWMVYFTYGGIENLQRQIDAINGDIEDMKDGTVAGSLQNQITANDTEIANMKDGTVRGSLQSQINVNAGDISDMKNGTVTGSLQNQINAINTSMWRTGSIEASTDSPVALKNSNGADMNASGRYLITLNTVSGNTDSVSQYATRDAAIKPLHEGADTNAPRLSVVDGKYSVSMNNTGSTAWGVYALIQAF